MTEEKRVPIPERWQEEYALLLQVVNRFEVNDPAQKEIAIQKSLFEELGAAGAERDQLKAELAEMQWKPITPDSLPKDGDEISDGRFRVDDASSHIPDWGEEKMTDVDWHLHGWTHYRAINPTKP